MGKPDLHGRDHRPGGMDPIVGAILSGIPYAYVQASDTLPAGPTSDVYFFDTAAPSGAGAGPFTNDPDTFTIETLTIGAGAGKVNSGDFRGISVNVEGMYVAFKTIHILTLYSDTTLRAISLYQQSGSVTAADMEFGDQNHMSQGHGQNMELWEFGSGTTPPSGAIILGAANGESSAYTVSVSMLVLKLDSTAIPL